MAARLHYRFYTDLNVISCYTEIENQGKEPQGLEAVTSFSLPQTHLHSQQTRPFRLGARETTVRSFLFISLLHPSFQNSLHRKTYGAGCIN